MPGMAEDHTVNARGLRPKGKHQDARYIEQNMHGLCLELRIARRAA